MVPAECVVPVRRDPKVRDYGIGSAAAARCHEWNRGYTEMLQWLHEGFNGAPHRINDAISRMTQLSFAADGLVEIELDDGTRAAPTFEYVDPTT